MTVQFSTESRPKFTFVMTKWISLRAIEALVVYLVLIPLLAIIHFEYLPDFTERIFSAIFSSFWSIGFYYWFTGYLQYSLVINVLFFFLLRVKITSFGILNVIAYTIHYIYWMFFWIGELRFSPDSWEDSAPSEIFFGVLFFSVITANLYFGRRLASRSFSARAAGISK